MLNPYKFLFVRMYSFYIKNDDDGITPSTRLFNYLRVTVIIWFCLGNPLVILIGTLIDKYNFIPNYRTNDNFVIFFMSIFLFIISLCNYYLLYYKKSYMKIERDIKNTSKSKNIFRLVLIIIFAVLLWALILLLNGFTGKITITHE